jgi:hypothetical protein
VAPGNNHLAKRSQYLRALEDGKLKDRAGGGCYRCRLLMEQVENAR